MRKIYGYKKESRQNPYIGFMSFNHFRDEKLYSDCIVGRGKPSIVFASDAVEDGEYIVLSKVLIK